MDFYIPIPSHFQARVLFPFHWESHSRVVLLATFPLGPFLRLHLLLVSWNSLLAHIGSIDTLSTFKRHLNFHLFQSACTVKSSCASASDSFSRCLALYKFVRMHDVYSPNPHRRKLVKISGGARGARIRGGGRGECLGGNMASAEHERITGVWGRAPSWVQGHSPWSGGQGSEAPLKLKAFWSLDVQRSRQI